MKPKTKRQTRTKTTNCETNTLKTTKEKPTNLEDQDQTANENEQIK